MLHSMADINWLDLPVLLLSREFLKQEKQLIENVMAPIVWSVYSIYFIFLQIELECRHYLHLSTGP